VAGICSSNYQCRSKCCARNRKTRTKAGTIFKYNRFYAKRTKILKYKIRWTGTSTVSYAGGRKIKRWSTARICQARRRWCPKIRIRIRSGALSYSVKMVAMSLSVIALSMF
tara:strand:- start:66 stop:398 length:333 start_codon:yes stop_codon:yes gene_type:complete